MASEDKLNFDLRRALKEIAGRNIPFNPAEASDNVETVERTMKGLVDAMKEVDPLFQEILNRSVLSSSFFEKVSIKKAEEFDLNLILRLPFQSEDIETCFPEEATAFVTYRLKRDPTLILDHDRKWTPELFQKLPEFFDPDLLLLRSKVQEWMQCVVDKAWKGRKFPQMLKRHNETGSTFVISFKKRKLMIDIVPVIEGHQNVPPRGITKSERFMKLKQMNQAKGKNRQNIHRKTPHPNMSRGHAHVAYTPRGHDNRYAAKVYDADALDTDDMPHRPPPRLNDFVPNGFGNDDGRVEYEEDDDQARGYVYLRETGGASEIVVSGGRGGFHGRSSRGRGESSGGWQVAGPKRLPVHAWYLNPKLYKQQNVMFSFDAADAYWRLSFPEAEKRLLQNTGCLTMLIRLFKFLRNKQNWTGLSSYSIKTLFVEEFESLDVGSDYWMETKLGTLFLDMLYVLSHAIRKRHIPHYFNREANLLENLNEETSDNIASFLEAMSSDIRRNPHLVYKHFGC